MEKFLPLFPLPLVAFPGESLNLHIFEPRYRQLIEECETEGILFGIPAFINGNVMDVGTTIQLQKVEKRYDNGELDVVTKGLGLFRIQQFYREAPGKLYAGAEVQSLDGDTQSDPILTEKILDLLRQLFALLHLERKIPERLEDFRTYDWGHHVGFSLEEEYKLLCVPDENGRQEVMLEHLERVLPTVKEMENLRQRVLMNGHFKDIIPPKL